MNHTKTYPLKWPAAQHRTAADDRREASYGNTFKQTGGMKSRTRLTLQQACKRVEDELRRMGVPDPIISSDQQLKKDGTPRGDRGRPADPGVAVYFTFDGHQQCVAIDCWDRLEDNAGAVAKVIESLRSLDRVGGARMVSAAFTGFKALPAPGGASSDPQTPQQAAEFIAVACGGRDVTAIAILGDPAEFDAHRRTATKRYHPDRYGGNPPPDWFQLQSAIALLERHHGRAR